MVEPVLNYPLPDRSLEEQLPFRTKLMPSHQMLRILSNPEGLCASGGPYLLPELGPPVDNTIQIQTVWALELPHPSPNPSSELEAEF